MEGRRSGWKLDSDCHVARRSNRRCSNRLPRSSWWCSRASSEFPPCAVSVLRGPAGYNAWLTPDRRMTQTIGLAVLLCLVCTLAEAQSLPRMFAGVDVGIATLAADARSEIGSNGADVSLYEPENGPALNVFVGSN